MWKVKSDDISIAVCLVKLIYMTVVTLLVSFCDEDSRGAERSKVEHVDPDFAISEWPTLSVAELAVHEQQEGCAGSNPVWKNVGCVSIITAAHQDI